MFLHPLNRSNLKFENSLKSKSNLRKIIKLDNNEMADDIQ